MRREKNKGITLIALIITIIVLLILAGVALATLTGDSGILSNADKAKENTNLANSREQVQLAVQAALIEGLGTVTKTELVAELNNLVGQGKYTITPDEEEGPWIVTVNGFTFQVTKEGNIEEVNGIILSKKSLQMLVGDEPVAITATMSAEISGTIEWISSNTSVATVSNGTITAVGDGEATITARVISNGQTYEAKCEVTVTEKPINVTAIGVGDITIEEGQNAQLTITKTPSNSNEELTYTSSKPEIATVDNAGKVTAVAVGTTTITVVGKISTDVKGTCTVTVTEKPINVTAISVGDVTLEEGQSSQLTVTKTPSNSNEELTYTSSNTAIATVDGTGKVTAVAEGTTTITVAGRISTDVKGTATITVTKPVLPAIGDYVTYNVSYTDMYTYYEFTTSNGWRILNPGTSNGDGTYSNVKLISTGIPAKLNYSTSTNAGNAANGWWGTDAQVERIYGSTYSTGYSKYPGRYAAVGLKENFELIPFTAGTSASENQGCFRKINSTETGSTSLSIFKATGASEVHNLTLEELNTARGLEKDSKTKIEIDGGLFFLRSLIEFDYSVYHNTDYWLDSPDVANDSDMGYINSNGYITSFYNYSDSKTYGVRVVVSLSSNIKKNTSGNWEIVP